MCFALKDELIRDLFGEENFAGIIVGNTGYGFDGKVGTHKIAIIDDLAKAAVEQARNMTKKRVVIFPENEYNGMGI